VNSGKGIYVGGTLVSILISLALYATGRRETAIFVGLWAPTILNLGQSLLEEDYIAKEPVSRSSGLSLSSRARIPAWPSRQMGKSKQATRTGRSKIASGRCDPGA